MTRIRISILLIAVLALVLAACGADETATTSPTPSPTVEATEAATPTPTEEPTSSPDATDDDADPTGALADVLPDEVAGLQRQDTGQFGDMLRETMARQLDEQGMDVEDLDFAYAIWGEGELVVTAFAAPGMDPAQLEQLAQLMSGMQVEGADDLETETTSLGGKEVVRVTTADQPQSVFIYTADDAFFTVVSESDELAEELLSQLP